MEFPLVCFLFWLVGFVCFADALCLTKDLNTSSLFEWREANIILPGEGST